MGQKLREKLLPLINGNEKVVLDFTGVNVVSNIFAGNTLRATGDVVYPFVVGVILVRRWRSGKWRKKGFVKD